MTRHLLRKFHFSLLTTQLFVGLLVGCMAAILLAAAETARGRLVAVAFLLGVPAACLLPWAGLARSRRGLVTAACLALGAPGLGALGWAIHMALNGEPEADAALSSVYLAAGDRTPNLLRPSSSPPQRALLAVPTSTYR